MPLDAELERGPQLRVLPGPAAVGAEQDGYRPGVPDGRFERFGPGPAGDQLALVEPDVHAARLERVGELAHRFLVGAAVAEENIEAVAHGEHPQLKELR